MCTKETLVHMNNVMCPQTDCRRPAMTGGGGGGKQETGPLPDVSMGLDDGTAILSLTPATRKKAYWVSERLT